MINKMGSQNQNFHKWIIFPVLIAVLLSLGFSLDSQAQEGHFSDELFDQSLSDLRSTMEKVRQSNDAFKENNRFLLKEIDALKAEIIVAQDEPAQEEDVLGFSSATSSLQSEENALYESRIKNLSSRLSRFMEDKVRLEKKIKGYHTDNEFSQKRIDEINKEIGQTASVIDDHKSAVAQNSPDVDVIFLKISACNNRVDALKKQLASSKSPQHKDGAESSPPEKIFWTLSAEFSSAKEELARLRGEKKLMLSEIEASAYPGRTSDHLLRQKILDLRVYRNQLRKALSDLQNATIAVKPDTLKDLSGILRAFEQKRNLLKREMDLLVGQKVSVRPSRKTRDLVALRSRLSGENKRLEVAIAKAQKKLARKNPGSAGTVNSQDSQLRNKISQSAERLRDLRQQIEALQGFSSFAKMNEALLGQVESLEKDLAGLRNSNRGKDVSVEKGPGAALGNDLVKEEISQLKSRRDALLQAVENIENKYPQTDIVLKDSDLPEVQLNEYLGTLTIENTALQQKLLTFQMRQDKQR